MHCSQLSMLVQPTYVLLFCFFSTVDNVTGVQKQEQQQHTQRRVLVTAPGASAQRRCFSAPPSNGRRTQQMSEATHELPNERDTDHETDREPGRAVPASPLPFQYYHPVNTSSFKASVRARVAGVSQPVNKVCLGQ